MLKKLKFVVMPPSSKSP